LGHTGVPRRPTEFRVVPGPGRCDGEVMPNARRGRHPSGDLAREGRRVLRSGASGREPGAAFVYGADRLRRDS
jgi:hypothetical protein